MDLIEGTVCQNPELNRLVPGFLGTAIVQTVRKLNGCLHQTQSHPWTSTPTLFNYHHQLYQQSFWITANKNVAKSTWLQIYSASPISHNYTLQVCTNPKWKSIFKLGLLWPWNVSSIFSNSSLKAHVNSDYIIIFNFTLLKYWCVCLNVASPNFQICLWLYSCTVGCQINSMDISR